MLPLQAIQGIKDSLLICKFSNFDCKNVIYFYFNGEIIYLFSIDEKIIVMLVYVEKKDFLIHGAKSPNFPPCPKPGVWETFFSRKTRRFGSGSTYSILELKVYNCFSFIYYYLFFN